ncbi:hypothetical protein V5O48_003913 [Marasmius crinis-equi]|uniref:Carboxylic ester hydrolase n=1 Tax=Marasmius crinis-equi TaxID=585013 RepID=A0ABR3FS39_9AGAR
MVPKSLALLLSASTFLKTSFAADPDSDVVDTGYAKYLGNRTLPNAVAYLGIPYAEPPLGDLRFRAPVPLNTTRIAEESGGEAIDATEYPDFCIQGPLGRGDPRIDPGGAGSEDCLNLNIYAPAGAKKGDNLPVLFYIHGGGYVNGNPQNWPFDHWIQQSPNIVAVSIYYRLDAFGFLTHPDFASSENGDLNPGFLDQVEALRWVKANIESFGGDPSKVTINGESAGGGSVQHHLVAEEGEPLFSGAIAQSVYRARTPTPEQQQPLFEHFASTAGCDSGDVAAQVACLRNASVSTLVRAQETQFNGSYNGFLPVIDGKVIVGHATTLVKEGKFAKVPLIVGATSNETVSGGSNITVALQGSYPGLSDGDVQDILAVAPLADFANETQRFQDVTGESVLRCAREILGGAYSTAPKSWTYRYNQPSPVQSNPFGVEHAAENYMMFVGTDTGANGSTTFHPTTPVEDAFAEELLAYWISFVRSGDPNTFKLDRSPEWPQYTLEGADEIVKQRVVLQEGPADSTTESGSFIEQEPVNEGRRCEAVAAKSEQEQN